MHEGDTLGIQFHFFSVGFGERWWTGEEFEVLGAIFSSRST